MTTPGASAAPVRRFDAVQAAHPAAAAIVFMVLGSGLMTLQHAVVRYVSDDIPAIESVFFRNLFGFAVMLPWLLRVGMAGLRTRRIGMHAARTFLNALSLVALFAALATIPLADVTALNLTIPLFGCIGAVLFLGERAQPSRWIALAIGLAGALVIIRPGLVAISTGTLLILGSAVFAAGSRIMSKSLAGTDSPGTIVAWGSILMIPVTLVPAVLVWVWPTPWQWPLMVAIGALGVWGQLCFVRAYALADLTFAEPMVFSRLIWAAAIGFLWFGEIPDLWTGIGGLLIVAGTTVLARSGRGAASGP